ncbi:hypothetical protein ACJJTC_013537, partial [Scirpophaga incertulas]
MTDSITGLETRPRTCPPSADASSAGGATSPGTSPPGGIGGDTPRGRLDKSYSAPAYESDEDPPQRPPVPTEAVNAMLLQKRTHRPERPPSPPPRPSLARVVPPVVPPLVQPVVSPSVPPVVSSAGSLSRGVKGVGVEGAGEGSGMEAVPTPSPPAPRSLNASEDIRVIPQRRELPPINADSHAALVSLSISPSLSSSLSLSPSLSISPTISPSHAPSAPVVKNIFPTAKSKNVKKKNSLLATNLQKEFYIKIILFCTSNLCTTTAISSNIGVVLRAPSVPWPQLQRRRASGPVWQRVRAAGGWRWAPRLLVLVPGALYAYRASDRAACMIQVAGWTAAAAGEVRSRAHAFKVYLHGAAAYFCCELAAQAAAWLRLLAPAHAALPVSGAALVQPWLLAPGSWLLAPGQGVPARRRRVLLLRAGRAGRRLAAAAGARARCAAGQWCRP